MQLCACKTQSEQHIRWDRACHFIQDFSRQLEQQRHGGECDRSSNAARQAFPLALTGEFVAEQALANQLGMDMCHTLRCGNNDLHFAMPLLLRLPAEILSAATSALSANAMLRLRMTCTELCALATTNCKTPPVLFGHIGAELRCRIARKVGDGHYDGVDLIPDGMALMMLCCCSEL